MGRVSGTYVACLVYLCQYAPRARTSVSICTPGHVARSGNLRGESVPQLPTLCGPTG
jgi:hypothetical protein